MIVGKRWYKEEHARLLAIIDQQDEHIRELQGHAADLAAKLNRYEMCTTPAIKKKVAEMDAKNEAETKASGEQLIKDGKYQA